MRALLLLVCVGCAYKVPVLVQPAGGLIDVHSELIPAPADVRVALFHPAQLRLTAQGRRAMEVTIRWNALTMLKGSRDHEFRLVEEHGASGTWTR